MEAVPVTVLPPTTGKWEPIRNEQGVVTGYMEMFNQPEDLYFTVPRKAVLVVWSALQDHWELPVHSGAVPCWAIDVGREPDAVAHCDHLVLCHGDFVSSLGLRLGRAKRGVPLATARRSTGGKTNK